MSTWKRTLLIISLSVCFVGVVSSCVPIRPSDASNSAQALTPLPSSTAAQTNKEHIYVNGKVVVGGDGQPIELIENPRANNPTFAELVAFLEKDPTDQYSYIVGPPKNAFVCSDFAETVHNNAEAAGIRSAWVGIDIEGETEGHAISAFETLDLGLIYIDCTGKGLWDESPSSSLDRRANLEKGKPYAIAALGKAKSRFKFLISEPNDADRKYNLGDPQFIPFINDEQILSRLEELGWIRVDTFGPILASEKRMQNNDKMLEWSRKHDIEEVGLKWIQDWVREHKGELYGMDFEPQKYSENKEFIISTEQWVSNASWYILVDRLDASWFQPIEKLIDIDGIPIVWKIRWEMRSDLWFKPFGDKVVKDIHVQW